ncbi:GNAT family N-acetyltransferase [Herpetosiphon giganteus]|uniref:GNAT family N-acetyltransferase n=1 Tax=Herpetosiphon giganteus TaxID=2029754 RepID=UPI00195F197C|nr:GNAT family N-acetyltransferase [Herpetosiphon giganteus]MBM7845808.1 GNAT superfamily N-acetyltransferase [Herpetosiphon giganteus]
MIELLQSIEASVQQVASEVCTPIQMPPFVALIHPDDPAPWFNYAMPVASLATAAANLPALRQVFEQHQRQLRFEWTRELWPELEPLLQAAGIKVDYINPQMICPPEQFKPYHNPDIELRWLTTADDLALYRQVTRFGFGDYAAIGQADVDSLHTALDDGWCYAMALIEGELAAVGGYKPTSSGVVELVAIATLPVWRRRGAAASLTSFLVADHYAKAGKLAFLFAADAIAQATYAKIGFQQIATHLAATEE